MKRLQNKTNVTAPNAQFPYGAVKDNTGTNNGTPVNVDTYGDMHQFFEKLFAESGLTANGLPDDATNGFQLYQALITAGNYAFAQDIIKGLIGSYTTNDLIVLWGCTVSATIPGSSTITTGAIFYNGIIYKVPAATVVTISGETLVFKINATVQPGTIYLTNGTAGSGIANYNQATVSRLFEKKITAITDDASDDTLTGTYTALSGSSYTLPNDGLKRRFMIQFKCLLNQKSNTSTTSTCNIRIKNNTIGTVYDETIDSLGVSGLAIPGVDYVQTIKTIQCIYVGTITCNGDVIQAEGIRTASSGFAANVLESRLIVVELD